MAYLFYYTPKLFNRTLLLRTTNHQIMCDCTSSCQKKLGSVILAFIDWWQMAGQCTAVQVNRLTKGKHPNVVSLPFIEGGARWISSSCVLFDNVYAPQKW